MNLPTATVASVSERSKSDALPVERVRESILRFAIWLDRYGETSYDFQTLYASDLTRNVKAFYYRSPLLGTIAVAPIIFCEAFVPAARSLFWKRQRFPIADAHFAMGFTFLSQVLDQEEYYHRAIHFLEVLKSTRCPGYANYCWGYPFNWETIRGTIREGTPLITTVPYVYEAFRNVWQIDKKDEWLRIMKSIAMHGLEDYRDFETSASGSTCSYTPDPEQSVGVVNANAYRAFLLMQAAEDFSDERFRKVAERNLNFVLECQNSDGSWYYANDGKRLFIDHFHTCFVLKALVKIEQMTGHRGCSAARSVGATFRISDRSFHALLQRTSQPRAAGGGGTNEKNCSSH